MIGWGEAVLVMRSAWIVIGAILIAVPWLEPFAGGPSPMVTPLLTSVLCSAVLCVWGRPLVWPRGLTASAMIIGLVFAAQAKRVDASLLASWLGLLQVTIAAVIAAGCVRDDRLLPALAGGWLAAAMLSSIFGLVQYVGATQHLQPWINGAEQGVAYANLRQRNQLATLCNLGLLSLLWWWETRGQKLSRWGWAAMVLLMAANAATASRTGLLQTIALVVLMWRVRKNVTSSVCWLTAAVLPVYCICSVSMPWLVGGRAASVFFRLGGQGDGCSSRALLWSNVIELIEAQPWLGWGWRELSWAHYQRVFDTRFCEILDNAHNLPLHLAVELGLPVALLVCACAAFVVWRTKPCRLSDPTTVYLAWGCLLLIGLHSLLEYPLWYSPFQMAAGFAIGLLLARRSKVDTVATSSRRVLVLLSGLLMVGAAYAAWDYHRISQIYLPAESRSPAYRDNTLAKIQDSWLFRDQVRFAELTLTPVTRENAAHMEALALDLLHFSPEPRVIEKLIEAAVLLGHDDLAKFHMVRFRAAFPDAYAKWLLSGAQTPAT